MAKFKPMLAARKLPPKLEYPYMVSPKLDGYRLICMNGVAYSRRLKPIRNVFVQKYLGKKLYHGLDGETTVGPPNSPTVVQATGAIRAIEGKPDFTFHVFDDFTAEGGFEDRYHEAAERIADQTAGGLRVVTLKHVVVHNEEELLAYEQVQLDAGYEGVMLRSLDGPYKYGRSTEKEGYLMKLKRWTDDEMEITGFEEEMENTNEAKKDELGRTKRSSAKAGMVGKGRLGAFLGFDLKTQVEVRVGGGFTAKQREEFWRDRRKLKGEIVTYKHFDKTGVKDKRRFTIFRAFRDRDDL